MPIPFEYQRATDQFYEFLTDVRDVSRFGSSHQAYTMVQGVFQVFRRRIEIKQAIEFAGILPPVLRAIFVADWNTEEEIVPFAARDVMNEEVKNLRPAHNFSTDTAIFDVAMVLRRYVEENAFEQVLSELEKEAAEFWKV